MSRLLNFYIFLYNSFQFLGWAFALAKISNNFVSTKSVTRTYASAGEVICLFQTLAILEPIHGALGIVPNGLLIPLIQWGGRTFFVIALVRGIEEVQGFTSVFITFLTWCLIEVIRYSYYAFNCSSMSPYILTYLRYSAFILLFPIGFVGEFWLMYEALFFAKKKNMYAGLFAWLPISFSNLFMVLLYLYPFHWMNLYLHMFKQRRSRLGKYQMKKNN